MSLQSYIAESKKVSLGNGIELAFKPKNMPIAYYLMHKEVPLATCTFDLTGKSNLSLPSSYDKLGYPTNFLSGGMFNPLMKGKDMALQLRLQV